MEYDYKLRVLGQKIPTFRTCKDDAAGRRGKRGMLVV